MPVRRVKATFIVLGPHGGVLVLEGKAAGSGNSRSLETGNPISPVSLIIR
ncbi:MAG: hypothetical protein R3F19_11995 [Verrucomicrobiales bacterium]